MRAVVNGTVIAQSDQTIVLEGNHYFPPESLYKDYFQKSETRTTCPWKGEASYYDVVIGANRVKDAGWYYPETSDKAKEIEGYVAFWNGVEVID